MKNPKNVKIRLFWNTVTHIDHVNNITAVLIETGVTPGLDTFREYLFDNQSDNVANKMHPSP